MDMIETGSRSERATAATSPGPAGTITETPVGEWPAPVPRWPVVVSGLLWLAWAGFMVWMAILRIQGSEA